MISKRLQAVADLVKENSNVIDVGCDHALLDIYLTKNKNCNCIASDININALSIAKNNIKKAHLEDKINCILSDGLSNIDIQKESTIILCGMGTQTILEILNNFDYENTLSLIISTHNEYEKLRKELSKKLHLVDEIIIKEKSIYYLIQKWEIGPIKYSDMELYLGPILINKKNNIVNEYFRYLYNHNTEIINKLNPNHNKRKELEIKNSYIKKLNSISI